MTDNIPANASKVNRVTVDSSEANISGRPKPVHSATSKSSKISLKFASPVDARIISNIGDKYIKTVWYAIGLGMSHAMIGAVIMSTTLYSFYKGEFHGPLFALAYHFFSAEAIMSLSYINGWSTPMRWKHRKYTHIFLQLCGVFCAAIATAIITVGKGMSRTTHGLSGIMALTLTLATVVVGPFAFKGRHRANILHMSFGIPCFFTSSFCLCFGLIKPDFKSWAGPTIVNILVGFTIFYSALILVTTSMKYVKKI